MKEPGEKCIGDLDDKPVGDTALAEMIHNDPFHAGTREHGQVPRRNVRMTDREIETARKRLSGNSSRVAKKGWLR